ncbi:MAG TPA: SDR family NAD(P)-dependent oxidoreductase [Candidatus Competibacteraceae bacterium]|nr:SDR family NAD(P)-dependent oxidoreductase [Candidatus Competibacteraceae bacterium]HQA27215.1 SDR family NAD(P)-dependent oxidoreductase [Candidatus Competibacteraceae bacterium]HQD55157.1 SDR family NAD(P)-dependent oxidoreductase [Candidatus Competibacteraceae bacterium]
MNDRSVLITGCSSGIGERVALGLKERGWRVFATARQAVDVARLQAGGLESLPLDLRDSASIRSAVDSVLERTGGCLDALFNNAGYGQPGAVEDISRVALREQFETNVFGVQELTNRVIPVMRQQGAGRILYNSSVLGLVAFPYRGAYVASKFALEGLADTLRLELAGTGIHVCLIEPGPILSRFRDNAHAAYGRHVDAATSLHRAQYEAMEARLLKRGPAAPFTQPPEAVLQRVIHALESPRPQARYPVTFPTYLFAALRRLLPTRALDAILRRAGGEGRR